MDDDSRELSIDQQSANSKKLALRKALKAGVAFGLIGGSAAALGLYLSKRFSAERQSEVANNVLASGVMDQAKDAAMLDNPAKLNEVADKLVKDQLNGKPLPINSHGKPVHHNAVPHHKVITPATHQAATSTQPNVSSVAAAPPNVKAPTVHKPTHGTSVPPKHNLPGQQHNTGPATASGTPAATPVVPPTTPVTDATLNPLDSSLDAGAMPDTKVLSPQQIGAICVAAVVLLGIVGVLVYNRRAKNNEQNVNVEEPEEGWVYTGVGNTNYQKIELHEDIVDDISNTLIQGLNKTVNITTGQVVIQQ